MYNFVLCWRYEWACGFVLLQEDQVSYTTWSRNQIHNWKVIALQSLFIYIFHGLKFYSPKS